MNKESNNESEYDSILYPHADDLCKMTLLCVWKTNVPSSAGKSQYIS